MEYNHFLCRRRMMVRTDLSQGGWAGSKSAPSYGIFWQNNEIIKMVLTHLKIDRSFFIVENILHLSAHPSAVTGWVLVEIITYIIRQIEQFYDGKTM